MIQSTAKMIYNAVYSAISLGALIAALSLIPSQAFSQNHDSLIHALEQASSDKDKLATLLALGQLHWADSTERNYYSEARRLATKMDSVAGLSVELSEAEILFKKGEFERALSKAQIVIPVAQRLNQRALLVGAHQVAGQSASGLNQVNAAISHHQATSDLYRALGDSAAYCEALTKLGVIYKNVGVYNQALEVLLQGLIVAETLNDSIQQAKVLNNIGNVYKWQNNLELALNTHQRALSIRKALNNIDHLADSHNNIGLVLRKMDRLDGALSEFRNSIQLRKNGGHKRGLSYTYNNLALLHMDMGELDSTIYYLKESMKIKNQLGRERDLAIGHVNLGEAYLKKGDIASAEFHYTQSLSELPPGLYPEIELEALDGMSKLYEARSDFDNAYKYLRKHDLLEDSLEEANNSRVMSEMMASYDLQKAEGEMKRLEQQQRLQELELQNYELERNSLILLLSAIAIIGLMVLLRYRSVNQFNRQLKDANQELRETLISNEEKETLLKEIHHRVKNNLQIITSLIRLQSASINDPTVASLFNESQHRIKTMALVHEELYRTKNFTSVDVHEYLDRLVDDLINTYAIQREIAYEIDADVSRLGVNTLIPMGLIVNEIITNALKHAFKQDSGKISIALHAESSDLFHLTVADNGVGFPSDIDFDNPTTLGLDLINTLTDQLDGKVKYFNQSGAHYSIRFRCQD